MHKLGLATAFGMMCAMFQHPAFALNAKSFISNTGNDANTCADAANACATINGALNKTAAGGEISILTPGEYATGSVPISQAITIDNGSGGEASLRNAGNGTGMIISAGAGDVVILRGLTFEGNYTASDGIAFTGGLALQVENCVFRNWQGGASGLVFEPTGNSKLFVTDSTFFNNGLAGNSGGILVEPFPGTTGSATVMLDRVHIDFNVQGLVLDATKGSGGNGIHAVLRDSVVSGNAGDGVSVLTASGKPFAQVFIENSTMANNTGNGVVANGGHAVATLTGSKITRNGTGVSAVNGGQIISRGDNTNNFNLGVDGAATSFINPF